MRSLQRPLVLASMFFVAALMGGCSDEPGDQSTIKFDGGTCSQTNCSGCCAGDQCITQTSTQACGTAGFPCVICSQGESCQYGQCIPSTKCGPSTCPNGCCKGEQCLTGNDGNACGKGGALCADCSSGGGTCMCWCIRLWDEGPTKGGLAVSSWNRVQPRE